jgi:hypothetical protein
MDREIVPWTAPAAVVPAPAWRGAGLVGRAPRARVVRVSARRAEGAPAAIFLLALFAVLACVVLALATALRLAAGRSRRP